MALLPAAGHDQMWLLYAARLVLHGKQLYGPELFENNPPLIVWLSVVPEALAQWTGLPDTAVGKLFVLGICAGSGVLCARLLGRRGERLRLAQWLALAFAWIAITVIMTVRDFGQRDHLLLLCLLPYLFTAALRVQGESVAAAAGWLTGLLALTGAALKPHQMLVVLAVEIYLLCSSRVPLRRRWRQLLRPEMLAIFLAGAGYLAAVQIVTPLYLSLVVPIEQQTYWAYGDLSWPQLVAQAMQLHLLALLVYVLLFTSGWHKASAAPRVLTVAGSASLLAYYMQATGWYYQQLPALSFFALALTLLLIECVEQRHWQVPRWSPAAAALVSLVAIALTTHFANYPFTPERSFPIEQPDAAFFAGLADGSAVMTISPTVDDTIPPLFKFHLTLGQRYSSFVLLPALLRAETIPGKPARHRISPERLAELDQLQHRWMVEDLERWRPTLLLVERCQDSKVHCQVLEDRHDDLLAFFERDPAFRRIFAGYHFRGTAGAYDAYRRN